MLLYNVVAHPGTILELHDRLVEVGPEKLALLHLKRPVMAKRKRHYMNSRYLAPGTHFLVPKRVWRQQPVEAAAVRTCGR